MKSRVAFGSKLRSLRYRAFEPPERGRDWNNEVVVVASDGLAEAVETTQDERGVAGAVEVLA